MSQLSCFSYDEIYRYIFDKGCELLTAAYINAKQKLEIKCACGNIFNTTFDSFKFKNKIKCNNCSTREISQLNTLKYNDVKSYIESKNCKLLSDEYISVKQKLQIQCSCGNIFVRSFNKFNSSNQIKCLKCQNKRSWKFDTVKHFIEIESESGCVLLSNVYRDRNQKLNIKCSCSKNFITNFHTFLNQNKRHCDECSLQNFQNKKKKGIVFLKEYVSTNSESNLISEEYNNYHERLDFVCSCDNKFQTSFASFMNGKTKCNFCSPNSKLELLAEEYFINNKVNYETQYSFSDLRGINDGLLRFDFALFDKNNNLLFLVELDGEQHFKAFSGFGGLEKFETVKIHDNLKNEYSKNKGLDLYRISYNQKDEVEIILRGILCKYDNLVPSLV